MSGGGTAGHVYPALSVAGALAEERDDVVFVGTPDGLEARLVPEAGVAFRALPARGFDRSRPSTLATSSAIIAASTARAIGMLRTLRPDVVVGFGGFVSIPVGLAAVTLGVPLALHEQNSVPGLANRALSRWARSVAVTYEESARWLRHPERVVVTGNPVRALVREADASRGRRDLGVPDDGVLLLVFGGSRGARHVNTAVIGLRGRILESSDVHVVHVTGPAELESVRAALEEQGGDDGGRWRLYGYLDRMGDAMAAADLVVSRAGATSIAEITTLGKASVLVPYPFATDDHQTTNAEVLVEHGAARLIADEDLDSSRFGDVVVGLLDDADARASMSAASAALARPDAAERVAELVRETAVSRRRGGPSRG